MAKISRQMRQQANQEHALKISLEQVLIPRLRTLFNKFMRDFRKEFIANATVANAHNVSPELNNILTTSYKRTAAAFTENFLVFNSKQEEPISDEDNRAIEAAILAFILATVPVQVRFILNTTNKQLGEKIQEIVTSASAAGDTLSIEEIANQAFTQYSKILDDRINLIATFETQNSAEEAKSQVARQRNIASSTRRPSGAPPRVTKKIWVAILDSKTRFAHALADGQVRDPTEPFDVKGQQLMRPGDTSLGATPDNVMECRCSVIYS